MWPLAACWSWYDLGLGDESENFSSSGSSRCWIPATLAAVVVSHPWNIVPSTAISDHLKIAAKTWAEASPRRDIGHSRTESWQTCEQLLNTRQAISRISGMTGAEGASFSGRRKSFSAIIVALDTIFGTYSSVCCINLASVAMLSCCHWRSWEWILPATDVK